MPKQFKIKSDENPWDSITIADGDELAVGTTVYEGEETILVGGVETTVARKAWDGTYLLEEGKSVEVTDGIITEINEVPIAMKDRVAARREEIKEHKKLKYN